MNRREFIQAGASLVAADRLLATEKIHETGELKKFKITQITGFRHVCRRPRLVGKNSHLDIHGWETRDNVLRIATDQGISGVGVGIATPEKARTLLGHTLDEYWKPGVGMLSPLERADHALFDLVGKALNQPAWKLLGGRGQERVPVYDGGIYFNDLLPEHQERGVARLLEEVEESLKEGHRAFKIKIGRGFKWMDREAGFRRDIEVVKAIRRLVGKQVKLMVDANNGFDLETTVKFLQELGDELFFIEEMFPEQVEQDLELKRHLKEKGWKTRVADGESARDVDYFDAYIQSGALDVLQPDIRAFGLTRQWELSRKMAGKHHIKLAPHNWGSFLGLPMQAVLGRGIPNFLLAEQDRSSSDLFDTSAFSFREGMIHVPDLPGCGLILREDVFKQKYEQNAWTVTT